MHGSLRVAFRVQFAWWWRLYLWGIVLVSAMTQRDPDWNKVHDVMARAIRVRVVPQVYELEQTEGNTQP